MQRAQAGRWIRLADVVFVLVLAASSALAFQGHLEMAVLFLAAAVGALVAFTVIEPATTRAAFGDAGHRTAEPGGTPGNLWNPGTLLA